MLTVQVRTPKIKLSKHRVQNSQPTTLENLNSFEEFFKSQSNSNQKQKESLFSGRCKTESNNRNHTHKKSSQSTTISLGSSTSPSQVVTKQLNTNNSFKIIKKQSNKQVQPFQGVDQKLQIQLQKLLQRTNTIIHHYEVTHQRQKRTEQELRDEISKLKRIVEKQKLQLART